MKSLQIKWGILIVSAVIISLSAAGVSRANNQQPPITGPIMSHLVLNYVRHSSVKVEQIIGDYDYADWKNGKGTKKPTTSLTQSNADVEGNGLGYSFEDENGKMIFLFGDTIGLNLNYHAHDVMAWSTSTDPESGLLLNFFLSSPKQAMFVQPPGVKMGPFNIPNSGIDVNGQTYIVCSTGGVAKQAMGAASRQAPPLETTDIIGGQPGGGPIIRGGLKANPQENEYSVLTKFDTSTQKFQTGRVISRSPSGHFVIVAMHNSISGPPMVYIFGTGLFRQSNIYLSMIPQDSFWSGVEGGGQSATQYFTGLAYGQPTWSANESASVPVVVDNPYNHNPAPPPTAGDLSVVYCQKLGLWLMTYDGGHQTKRSTGAYFTYATNPWGPWAAPQLIYNDTRDPGLGVFIHDPMAKPSDNIAGPVIGPNNPEKTKGGGFAPELIERFAQVSGKTLTVYYTLSTWNPYTVVKMKSEFTISSVISPYRFQQRPVRRFPAGTRRRQRIQ